MLRSPKEAGATGQQPRAFEEMRTRARFLPFLFHEAMGHGELHFLGGRGIRCEMAGVVWTSGWEGELGFNSFGLGTFVQSILAVDWRRKPKTPKG